MYEEWCHSLTKTDKLNHKLKLEAILRLYKKSFFQREEEKLLTMTVVLIKLAAMVVKTSCYCNNIVMTTY